MTRIGVGNVTQRTCRWFANDSVMMHEGIEKLRELDRLFGQAERYTRRGEYTEAIQAYRTFARQAEDYLETSRFSEHTEECPFCGRPLEQDSNSAPREKQVCCSECRGSLPDSTHITVTDIRHFQRIAVETAQNLKEGKHGLDWTAEPPEEHPHLQPNGQLKSITRRGSSFWGWSRCNRNSGIVRHRLMQPKVRS